MKKSFVALLVAITIVVPSVSFGAGLSQSQIDAILGLLRSFGASESVVTNVTAALIGSGTPIPVRFCAAFANNLRIGDRGSEVSDLQTALGMEGYTTGAAGVFDEQTASSVVGFQEKYRSEILTPNGLVRGTGYVGVSTRAKLLRLYGCTVSSNRPPVISGLDAPTTLAVGEVGTWAVKASDPEGKSLSYSVIWGDESAYATGNTTAPSAERQFTQTATFSHSYATAGVYTPMFYVKDADGQSAKTSASVRVGTGITQSFTILPVTLETAYVGKMFDSNLYTSPSPKTEVEWIISSGALPSGISLLKSPGPCPIELGSPSGCLPSTSARLYGTPTLAGNYSFIIRAQIAGQTVERNYILFVVTNSSLTVFSPNGGESWQKGTTQTIKWQDNTPVSSVCSGGVNCTSPATRPYDIKLLYHPICTSSVCPDVENIEYRIATGRSGYSYSWDVGRVTVPTTDAGFIVPDGSYTIQVCQSSTSTCDSSDSHFKIYSPNTTTSTNIY